MSNGIPREVLLLIFGELTNRNDLIECSLVNNEWYIAAANLLWDEVECCFEDWLNLSNVLFASSKSTIRSTRSISQRKISLNPGTRDTTAAVSQIHESAQTQLHLPFGKISRSQQRSSTSIIDYRTLIHGFHLYALHPVFTTVTKFPNFSLILPTLSNLTSLQVDTPCLSDDDLWVLSKKCTLLTSISLVSTANESGRITDNGLHAIFQNSKQLRRFYLLMRRKIFITGQSVLKMVECNKHMESFGLLFSLHDQNSWKINAGVDDEFDVSTYDDQFVERLTKSLETFVTNSPALKQIALDLPFPFDNVLSVCENVKLSHLEVGGSVKLNSAMRVVSANRENLKSFKKSELFQSDAALQMFLRPLLYKQFPGEIASAHNPTLTSLVILRTASPLHVMEIAQMCFGLVELRVSITNRSAIYQLNGVDDLICNVFKNCRKLEIAQLPIDGNDSFSEQMSCQGLKELIIDGGLHVSDVGIQMVMRSCDILEHVSFGAAYLSDDWLQSFFEKYSHTLRTIKLPVVNVDLSELYGSLKVSKTTVEHLARSCKQLRVLEKVPMEVACDSKMLDWVKEWKDLRCLQIIRGFTMNRSIVDSIKTIRKNCSVIIC
ncbi:hypothetical protein HK098_006206 [Nowakowskiella sp. JEL0407]|nr:hypothetical protein HK098_006206 [Nowakowskiella sp. JEL0407]